MESLMQKNFKNYLSNNTYETVCYVFKNNKEDDKIISKLRESIEDIEELALIIDIIWLGRKNITESEELIINKLYNAANVVYNERKNKQHTMSERAMREVGVCDLERIGIQYESAY